MLGTTRDCYILNIKVASLMVSEKIFKVFPIVRGSFFMFIELGCISTNIKFTVP